MEVSHHNFRRAAAVLLSVIFVMAARPSRAQTPAPRFSGIEWGDAPSTARGKLTTSGFVVDSLDKDGDLNFHGAVSGNRAHGWIFFANEKAVKAAIVIVVPSTDVMQEYDQMKDALTRKYGPPQLNLEHYDPPYEKDDGYFQTALSVGKVTIATGWYQEVSGQKEGLVLTIEKNANLSLAYESAGWHAEVERRRDRATKAF